MAVSDSRGEVVLLDFWGVIGVVQSPESVAGMAKRLDVPVADFSAAYWNHRAPHDAGSSAADYWERVAHDLGVPLDGETLDALVELDVCSWSGVHSDMLELVTALRDAGCRLALLSNAPRDLVDHASAVLAGLVPQFLFSCDLGYAKPDPAAYELALEHLSVPASEVIFIDDNPGNVRAAQQVGMRAFQHVSVARTRATLEEQLGLSLG